MSSLDPWDLHTAEEVEKHLTAVNFAPFALRNFVGGSFRQHKGGSWIDSHNPQTGTLLAKVPASHAEDVEAAVAAATDAFPTWAALSPSARSVYLSRVAELMVERKEQLAVWESFDQGKTLARARVEIERAISNFTYFATYILHTEDAARWTAGNVLVYEHRSPAGPFALISPWNMPLYLLTWKIAPCIAFGCTAVAKPSEVTSVTAYLLGRILQKAQLPSGVVNIVFGGGSPTGSALVRHPRIKGVSFTGGTATGIQIRRDTVEDIGKHLSLELGGKNPTLVFDDVDLAQAVPLAAQAAFENQGEICLCGSRIYVQRGIYDQFVTQLVSHVRENFKLGKTVGPVVSLQHYRKVRSYLLQAAETSGSFLLGTVPVDTPLGGYWIEPTILRLRTSSCIMREEIFGPVVTVAPFETEDDAVALANDSAYGLASILMTNDLKRTRRVGERLESGLVWVNCWLVRELGTPFGGMKSSGTGREGGRYSRDVFTEACTIHLA